MNKIKIIWGVLIILMGCSMGPGFVKDSDLTQTEKDIRVFDNLQEAKTDCPDMRVLGIIEATSGSSFKMGTYEATLNALKRAAARKKANALYVVDHNKNMAADQATGKALVCKFKDELTL